MKEYAMYKGEECLAIGTIKEIAKQMKIKRETVYFYKTPAYKKRVKVSKNRRELITLD